MNAPSADAEDSIQFLLVPPSACSAVEAARVRVPDAPAHDAFTRLLTRLEPDPATLWTEVAPLLPPDGVLIIDDTTLDKPYARRMDLVTSHWSGRHKAVGSGINLVTAAWSDGGRLLPIDYRLAQESWAVETYQRGLKRYTEIERCQARPGRSQLNHIGLAIRAFLRPEWHRWAAGVTWFEAKHQIVRDAVRRYLAAPTIRLPLAATA